MNQPTFPPIREKTPCGFQCSGLLRTIGIPLVGNYWQPLFFKKLTASLLAEGITALQDRVLLSFIGFISARGLVAMTGSFAHGGQMAIRRLPVQHINPGIADAFVQHPRPVFAVMLLSSSISSFW
jgi:hypothetical protein